MRTRSFWELPIGTAEIDAFAAYLGSFEVAAEAVLRWLRGEAVPDILQFLRPHLSPRGSPSSGYRLGEPSGV